MALISVLSIYNGYDKLLLSQSSTLEFPLTIKSHRANKLLLESDPKLIELVQNPKFVGHSYLLNAEAVVQSNDLSSAAPLLGIDNQYRQNTSLDSLIYNGKLLTDTAVNYFWVGIALAEQLRLGTGFTDPVLLSAPKRIGMINPMAPQASFRSIEGMVGAIIDSQSDDYSRSILLSIEQVRDLLDYQEPVATALGLKLANEAETESIKKELRKQLGHEYQVLNRIESHPEISRLVAMEKWVSYLILIFILVLAIFNVINSLSMLLIEKREDVKILESLGASKSLLRRIFILEGMLISLSGAIIGLILGIVFCLLQQKFGFITVQQNISSHPYPVHLIASDILIVLLSIVSLSFIAAYYPVKQLIGK